MSNTQKRIISAIVMMLLVIAALLGGSITTHLAFLLVGILSIDEIFCNFFRGARFSPTYLITQIFSSSLFLTLNFSTRVDHSSYSILISLVINAFLISYLFFSNHEDKKIVTYAKKYPSLALLLILPSLMTLSSLLSFGPWVKILGALLVINFSMDTGAWFFGKSFGKNKLWPKVSPNKTIEGLVAGLFTSGIFGGLYWYFCFDKMSVILFIAFMGMGLFAQVGDLIQSKIKRQCGIKDSSSLIPGHGGVYDRIDSLIFLSPFFAAFLKYYITF